MVQHGKCFPDQLKYLSDTDESLAKNKSNFYPPRNRNITLDNYIDFFTKFPLEELQVKDIKRSNLTKEEQNALHELRGDSEILIFEADKGGAVVVMDRTYYADKILEMLNDPLTFEEITANKDKNVMKLRKPWNTGSINSQRALTHVSAKNLSLIFGNELYS